VWDAHTPLKETLTTLNDLVRIGKVRYVGASNYNGWQLQRALDLSKHIGLERKCQTFDTCQKLSLSYYVDEFN